MNGFLVDVNLPRNVGIWKNEEFMFVVDIDRKMKDSEIWNLARTNDLTILTKDADFSRRIIVSAPPPRVVHFQIGNMLLLELKKFIDENWEDLRYLSTRNKLVSVYRDRIALIE